VWNRLVTAPWWALSLLSGSAYALANVLTGRHVGDESWTEAVVSGLVVGAVFGAVMGPVAARMNRRFREAAGDVPRDQWRRVARSARRGPVPEDPQLRRAARRVALQQREQMVSQRRWVLPLLGVVTAFLLWVALRDGRADPVTWLVIVLLLGLIATHLLMARHLTRRAELLADPPGEQRRT
jgi:cytochrome bd-type quinol oxidase subunit 2